MVNSFGTILYKKKGVNMTKIGDVKVLFDCIIENRYIQELLKVYEEDIKKGDAVIADLIWLAKLFIIKGDPSKGWIVDKFSMLVKHGEEKIYIFVLDYPVDNEKVYRVELNKDLKTASIYEK